YRREADRLTQQMDRRLATIRTELDQRMKFVSALSHDNAPADVSNIVTVMGDAGALVDALEYKPLHPAAPAEVETPAAPPPEPAREARLENPAMRGPRERERRIEVRVAEHLPGGPPPGVSNEPVVIEIPPVPEFPRYVVSEEQRELISDIGRLAAQLTNRDLDPDERKDIEEELRAARTELTQVINTDRGEFQAQMEQAQQQMRERQRQLDRARAIGAQRIQPTPPPGPRPEPRVEIAEAAAIAQTPKAADAQKTAPEQAKAEKPKAPKAEVRKATPKELAASAATAKKTKLILGKGFVAPVSEQGKVVGQLTARVDPQQVIHRVLGGPTEDRSEIPFALDSEGTLYTRTEGERSTLHQLGIAARVRAGRSLKDIEGWIVSTSTDPQSGLKIGVARPIDNLTELRAAAGRNFMLGMGLIAFALIGIVPLSNHLTRDVKLVTEGADRIAHGDLMTRLPVKTKNELGQLARAFNRMAEDLSVNQQKLLEQERARKEQELQQRLLAVEYERKTSELEDARRFQLSMLPKHVPQHAGYDVAVFTRTATEVGGDYYDFHVEDGVLSVTIGDATGHGAKAGTMVTVIKTLFAGYNVSTAPAAFLADAAEKIKRMDLGRMAMALSVARFTKRTVTVATAGMPPLLIHRAATSLVEEVALAATPLGTFGSEYPERAVQLERGDTVLFLTDGFPELMNDAGQQLGYNGAHDAFAAAAKAGSADGVIASLADTARRWHGDAPPNDDVTFVVVRMTA
ncbi:MAG: SpoIIE family protein phosphatase, partial [Acidobacteriota bacterium]|nr:SpoIIE family protein phosphatase [Acidobacteriota bacterium]